MEALWEHLGGDDFDEASFQRLVTLDGADGADGSGRAGGSRGSGAGSWVDEWCGDLRASLDGAFESLWLATDGDQSGELDPKELDGLCAQMLRALDPGKEPTPSQVCGWVCAAGPTP